MHLHHTGIHNELSSNNSDAVPEGTVMWEVECAGAVQVAEPITYTRTATTFTYVTSFL